MSMRDRFGASPCGSGITLTVVIGGLFALTLLLDYGVDQWIGAAPDAKHVMARRDACPAWKARSSQTLALFVTAVESEPAMIENCFRAGDRADALAALRERRKARFAAAGD